MKRYILSASFGLVMAVHLPSSAAAYPVTTTNDAGPGSLRAVITTANGVTGPHTVNFANSGHFAVGGTVGLVSPLPVIIESTTIAGWRGTNATINAIRLTGSPIVFAAGTTNSLQQLDIGGAITNGQSISITGCVITNGGIYSTGILQIASSIVRSSPTAGIWSSGNATLSRVTISSCAGRGILNNGQMMIGDSLISNNTCSADGAGICSSNTLQLVDCQVIGNSATNGRGGGVFNAGFAFIAQSTVASNVALAAFGGGIFNKGQITVVGSVLVGNNAQGQLAEAQNYGFGGNGGGGGGFGGAIFVESGQVSMTNATIYGNMAKGGAGGGGNAAQFSNGSTGSGLYGGTGGVFGSPPSPGQDGGFASGGGGGGSNPNNGAGGTGGNGGFGGGGGGAGYGSSGVGGSGGFWGGPGGGTSGGVPGGGGGGAGLGGAIFVQAGTVEMINCTVSQNQGFGGPPNGQGAAACYNYGGMVSLVNTLIASNLSSHAAPPDVYGSFSSLGYNFLGNSSGSTGWDPVTDYQNAIPLLLDSLKDNGGHTLTCALLPGSLCILAGTSIAAPPMDQRGVIRPFNKCDIGAYQFTTLVPTIVTWTNPTPIVYGTALSSIELNAMASVGGLFNYIPPAGTVLNAGSSQLLTAIFTPADPASYTGASNTVLITVLKANQTINFASIPPQSVNASPIILNATASSGLPVSFMLVSGDALLAGNLLSVGSTPGQVVVRALQAGNSNYLAAADVDQSFLVVAGSNPSITSQPTNQTVGLGGNATFSVSATTAPLTYQWQFHGLGMPGETNQSLSLLRVKPSQAGPYRVIVSNPIGSVTSLTAVLTINAPAGVPVILSQPQGVVARQGEAAKVSVVASGSAPLRYQWFIGASGNTNSPIVGANAASYTTPPMTNTTGYWVCVTNSLGLVDSTVATVPVLPRYAARLKPQIIAGFPVIQLDGAVGTNYTIQYKNSLTESNWSQLLDFNLSANPFTYFDTTAVGTNRRYYRAVAH